MPDDRYRLQLGQFEILIIRDYTMQDPATRIFANDDPQAVNAALRARGENPDELEVSYNCVAVYTDDDWVLIDAGAGTLTQPEGQTRKVIEDEQIRLEHIILTHAHPDHYCGLIDEDGGEAFPNVPVYMCQDEWAVCTSSDYADENPGFADMIQQYLMPLRSQIERVECWGDVLPGFSILRLPGHTEHHIGIVVESRGQRLVIAADAAIHPLHIEHPDWQFPTDVDHERARESRIKLAEYAIEHDAIVACFHFPFPGLGKIVRNGDSYRWQRLDT